MLYHDYSPLNSSYDCSSTQLPHDYWTCAMLDRIIQLIFSSLMIIQHSALFYDYWGQLSQDFPSAKRVDILTLKETL